MSETEEKLRSGRCAGGPLGHRPATKAVETAGSTGGARRRLAERERSVFCLQEPQGHWNHSPRRTHPAARRSRGPRVTRTSWSERVDAKIGRAFDSVIDCACFVFSDGLAVRGRFGRRSSQAPTAFSASATRNLARRPRRVLKASCDAFSGLGSRLAAAVVAESSRIKDMIFSGGPAWLRYSGVRRGTQPCHSPKRLAYGLATAGASWSLDRSSTRTTLSLRSAGGFD